MVSLSLLRLFGYYVFYDCRCFQLRVFVRLFSVFRDTSDRCAQVTRSARSSFLPVVETPQIRGFVIAQHVFRGGRYLLRLAWQNVTHDLRQEFGEFDLHHQLARLKYRQSGQTTVENVESIHRRAHVHIEGDAHRARVEDPRLTLVIDDHPRPQHIAHVFHIEFPAQRLFAVFQKSDIAGQYPIELPMRERRVLFVYPAVALALAFQLDHPVAVIVNTDTVFLAHQHAVHLLLVGGVPIIVEIQAANHIAAATRMAVLFKQRSQTQVQIGFLPVRNQILELMPVMFLTAARRHGKLLADTTADPFQQFRRPAITAH